jgi:UDP-N-acetylmuramate dehydrogenase
MTLISGFEHVTRAAEPLAPFTSLRIGGAAEYFVEPTSVDELQTIVRRCREQEVPMRLLGGGSNVLVRENGVPGVVLHLSAPVFCQIQVSEDSLTAGGGARLNHAISTSVREGLAGLDQLVGIPGTVGGALHGNAGGHGGDIGQWTRGATVMTRGGEIITRQASELHFAYRESSLDELVILEARFQLEREDRAELTRRMQKTWIVKKSSQPISDQNAAWAFKNSRGMNAADLVEGAGLTAARCGEAEISDRQANFIIAHPGATSDDVLRLIDLVRKGVADRLGVELETGIEVW